MFVFIFFFFSIIFGISASCIFYGKMYFFVFLKYFFQIWIKWNNNDTRILNDTQYQVSNIPKIIQKVNIHCASTKLISIRVSITIDYFSRTKEIQDEYSDIIREKLSMLYSSRIRFVAG